MDLSQLVRFIVLALLQGVTELFPVSSLGHMVILPGVLNWGDVLGDPNFVAVLVMLHLGTAAALLLYFRSDWIKLLQGGMRVLMAGRLTQDVDPGGYGRQLVLVIVGCVPVGIAGVLLQKVVETSFSIPILAAAFLVMNGAVLLGGEMLWRGQRERARAALAVGGMKMGAASAVAVEEKIAEGDGKSINDMSFMQALLVGFAQAFALIPGFSRSGLTMVAGMATGLSHEAAARFAFLTATPIILGAGIIEVPKLLKGQTHSELIAASIGAVVAGTAAYLSVRFLMKYFETNRLDPFAYYCIGVGLVAFLYFALVTFKVI